MRIPGWVFVLGLALFVLLTAVGSVFAFVVTRDAAINIGATGAEVMSFDEILNSVLSQPTDSPTAAPTTAVSAPTQDTSQQGVAVAPTLPPAGPTPTPDPLADAPIWRDPRRINILLLGIDERSAVQEAEPAFRTDTIMIISIDPVGKTAGMLSVPRDLWVTIPGFTQDRINNANYLGDINNYPGGGGPALAAATIRENLGVPIDYYVRVNFEVFITTVNTLAPSGVQVCPQTAIDDPTYPDEAFGTISVHFDAGCQRLDAVRLLQYARTRKTENGDFDRALRQQEVLQSFRDEVLSVGGLTNALLQAPTLFGQLGDNIETNLSLEQILSLARLAGEIPRESIRADVIDFRHASPGSTPDGTKQILIPRQQDMVPLIDYVLYGIGEPPAEGTADSGTVAVEELSIAELRTRAEAENATIVVFNGGNIPGLAATTREWLVGRGVSVAEVGNLPNALGDPTTIRDYGSKPYTARYLAALFGLPLDRIVAGNDGLTTADVMVVAGPDIQALLGQP